MAHDRYVATYKHDERHRAAAPAQPTARARPPSNGRKAAEQGSANGTSTHRQGKALQHGQGAQDECVVSRHPATSWAEDVERLSASSPGRSFRLLAERTAYVSVSLVPAITCCKPRAAAASRPAPRCAPEWILEEHATQPVHNGPAGRRRSALNAQLVHGDGTLLCCRRARGCAAHPSRNGLAGQATAKERGFWSGRLAP